MNSVDSRVWKAGKDSGFLVKSAYAILRGPVEGKSEFVFLWKTTALPSAQIITWRVLINSIATKDNLERRGDCLVNVVWNCVWIAVVSELWKHRNKHIFQGGVIDPTEVFTLAQLKVWSWVTSKTVSASFTYSEWCIDPKAVPESPPLQSRFDQEEYRPGAFVPAT
ncbi:uncharacterized protein [Phaseolus vulgaris]|uniref:uncharacterized protein n=1 Tax=Phaseolus vulgaris TaxID=3885 RepID=UPI0035CC2D17